MSDALRRAQRSVTPAPLDAGVEAGVGIEPAYTDLQSAAWPLCHPARGGSNQERAKSLELSTSTLARLRSTN